MFCVSGIFFAACAVGGTVWYVNRPPATLPGPVSDKVVPKEIAKEESGPSLPESERRYLWDLEHHGNVLNTYGFKTFAKALGDADAKKMLSMLAPDFQGQLLGEPQETSVKNEVLHVVRREDGGKPPLDVGPEEFVAHLLEYRRAYTAKPPGIQFVLKTLGPKKGREMDGPWQGLAFLRLYGEAQPGRPREAVLTLRYEVVHPTEEALAGKGWLRAAGIRQSMVGQAKHFLLPDMTREHGLDPSLLHDNWDPTQTRGFKSGTGSVYVCDYNRDGYLDLVITDLNCFALYKGGPDGKFVDVTAEVGLPQAPEPFGGFSFASCWIDIDGDGWDDLILAGRVYRNINGQRFEDYTHRTNLRLPKDIGSLIVADYDRDGKLDLYATRTGFQKGGSWLSGKSGADAANHLFRNLGNWQFEDVTKKANAAGGQRSTFTAVWLDANNDGWPDLFVTNEFGNGVLLENLGNGTFRERALGPGYTDFGTMGAAAGDLTGSGNIDIYCANMFSKAGTRVIGNLAPGSYSDDIMAKMRRFVAGSQLHINKGNFRFEQVGEKLQINAVGWAYGCALADLDNDGWLDIFATAGYMSRDRSKPDG
jgi:hypothetical protein